MMFHLIIGLQKFIQELARRDVIAGFPDGSFRPEQPVNARSICGHDS